MIHEKPDYHNPFQTESKCVRIILLSRVSVVWHRIERSETGARRRVSAQPIAAHNHKFLCAVSNAVRKAHSLSRIGKADSDRDNHFSPQCKEN